MAKMELQIINDTFTTVNSNLKLCKSIVEAEKIVKTGEDEIMKTLKILWFFQDHHIWLKLAHLGC